MGSLLSPLAVGFPTLGLLTPSLLARHLTRLAVTLVTHRPRNVHCRLLLSPAASQKPPMTPRFYGTAISFHCMDKRSISFSHSLKMISFCFQIKSLIFSFISFFLIMSFMYNPSVPFPKLFPSVEHSFCTSRPTQAPRTVHCHSPPPS